jgi:pimeloyl-ACP methyl ester carboxylesterase
MHRMPDRYAALPWRPRAATSRRGKRRRLYTLGAVALLVLAAWLAALGSLWLAQEKLLFKPVALDASVALVREADVHERFVDIPGARLSVLELRLPNPRGVVFYLHGNSGNLGDWFVNTGLYRRANFDLVMLDYRGFGKSTGRITSEAQLHADVEAVWRDVAPRYQGLRVVFQGRSLGTGLAVALAAKVQPDLTLLASPYSSMAALARLHYPWVPAAVLRYPLRTDHTIAAITTPVVLIHGENDQLVPLSHSEALQQLCRHARLVRVAGAGHADLQDFEPYGHAVTQALSTLR